MRQSPLRMSVIIWPTVQATDHDECWAIDEIILCFLSPIVLLLVVIILILGSHLRSPHWYILVQFNSTLWAIDEIILCFLSPIVLLLVVIILILGSHLRSPHLYILVQFNSTLPLGRYAQSHYALLVHRDYALHSTNGLFLLSLLFNLVLSRTRKRKYSGKILPSATLYITNPTWPDLE
jgi:hypothetical protein